MSELTFEYDKENNRIRVHSEATCGKRFQDVASIYEPDSDNPALDLNGRALGVWAVSKIIEYVEERKRKNER
jgi:hypothetical protein